MESFLLFPVGRTIACQNCVQFLSDAGVPVIDHPSPEITHLLLDVPSFQADGCLRSGGTIETLLPMLPGSITIVGGNLNHPSLANYQKWDLLQDAYYLAENAAITSDCALQIAARELPVVFSGCSVLVVGWGRIGKCLSQTLKALHAKVTIAARKEMDLAMIRALGYEAIHTDRLAQTFSEFRIVFNTVPVPVLKTSNHTHPNRCLWIELASKPGMEGSQVISARGLPGIHAPESSGLLIAKTVLRYLRRK